jgi:hypothetical protein
LIYCSNIKFIKLYEVSNFHSFFQKYVWAYSNYLGLNKNLIITSPKQRKIFLEKSLSHISDYTGDDEQYGWAESLLEGEFYPLTLKEILNRLLKINFL